MKRILNISNTKNSLVLILGVFAALTILSSQVYMDQITPQYEVTQDTNTDDSGDHEQIMVKAADAVSSTVHITLTHQLYFIQEILLSEDDSEERTFIKLPKLSTFFTTLFRQIISPNAP